jgi:WD repeat-containing protein 6
MHIPVTALETCQISEYHVTLVGQGPFLRVYEHDTHALLATARLFDVQPIHHIACAREHGGHDGTIIAVGGRYVAKVVVDATNDGHIAVQKPSISYLPANEWVLRIHSHEDACVLLTTNNVLYKVCGHGTSQSDIGVPRFVEGPGSSLYSGDICSISAHKLLVAAGSVFGEVLIWSCESSSNDEGCWQAQTLHRFEGHTGSVFGVRISDELTWAGQPARFVLSCSDDRTVQLWDASEDQSTTSGPNDDEIANTGFGHITKQNRRLLASGWGHQSRIWDVEFVGIEPGAEETSSELLSIMSRGEDSTCLYWRVSLPHRDSTAQDPAKIEPLTNDRYHSGKNVWSWTNGAQLELATVITGGADGRIVRRECPIRGACDPRIKAACIPFKQAPLHPALTSLKEYAISSIEDNPEIIAIDSEGEIVRYDFQIDDWRRVSIAVGSERVRAIKTCGNSPLGMVIAATTGGIFLELNGAISLHQPAALNGQVVTTMHVAGSSLKGAKLRLCVVVTLMSGAASAIWIEKAEDNWGLISQALQLPEHFLVTSSTYSYHADLLVLGSRAGALAIFPSFKQTSKSPIMPHCTRHVHGSDAVTSLQFLVGYDAQEYLHVLSTGRDGQYAIHRVAHSAGTDAGHLKTIHRASPPFGPYIEGAYIIPASSNRPSNLMLYGFRSKHFVVWNETKQTEIFSIDCGGAHRSWAYRQASEATQDGGTFVWTKAGTFNTHSEPSSGHQVVQAGGHGREIKALAVSPRTCSLPALHLSDAPLFATGAEDTTVRMFAFRETGSEADHRPDFIQLCTMNDHTAGLQDLVFTPDGSFLFSCGGAEQLYAHSIFYDVPLVGVGSVIQDKMRQTDDDADVRIMNVSLLPEDHDCMGVFRLAAAYSNGKVKLMRYMPTESTGKGTWELDREVAFGTFCVMQVAALPAAYARDNEMSILTAGTTGFINLTHLSPKTELEADTRIHSVHQSSVLAMDIVGVAGEACLVATGGDDNALGLTVLSASTIPDDRGPQSATVRIRDAHAAALTAIKILSAYQEGLAWRVRVATAGNDQRVNIWDVQGPTQSMESQSVFRVSRAARYWTGVADVSNIDLVGTRLLVTGVGVETLEMDLGYPAVSG